MAVSSRALVGCIPFGCWAPAADYLIERNCPGPVAGCNGALRSQAGDGWVNGLFLIWQRGAALLTQ